MPAPIVLASTSPYRRALLERLRLPFRAAAPEADEERRSGEDAAALARRLAAAKCEAVAATAPEALVIGSDQVACRAGEVLGKAGTRARARAQLRAASGNEVSFLTAVCVLAPGASAPHTHLDVTRVVFRALGDDEIERYLEVDNPLDCAGSFKAESLGVALFERMDSRDPTALVGLPLIWLAGVLRQHGWQVP